MKLALSLSLLAISNISFAQALADCKYPFNKSANSIVKYTITEAYQYNTQQEAETKFNSSEIRRYFFDPNIPINYDSVFYACISHLQSKLGKQVLCDNIFLYVNSFTVSDNRKAFTLGFGFTYPVIKREIPVNIGASVSYYETTNFVFEYGITENKKVYIKYPLDIPSCNNRVDCGIMVTREKGLEILKLQNVVKPNDKISMRLYGAHWNIQLTEDGWFFRNYSINIQTGDLVKLNDSQRID